MRILKRRIFLDAEHAEVPAIFLIKIEVFSSFDLKNSNFQKVLIRGYHSIIQIQQTFKESILGI